MLNTGTHRVTIKRANGGRDTNGLHLCDNCVTIVLRAFPSPDHLVVISPTPWGGPCDLDRYTQALSALLGVDPTLLNVDQEPAIPQDPGIIP
jgi:hypothetical protein